MHRAETQRRRDAEKTKNQLCAALSRENPIQQQFTLGFGFIPHSGKQFMVSQRSWTVRLVFHWKEDVPASLRLRAMHRF